MIHDDWRDETQSRLAHSNIYCLLKAKCENDPSGAQVLSLVDNATFYAYQRSKTILINMGEYTLHDSDHLFRVMNTMERLFTPHQLEDLSVPELLLLILSAFFHDIGMAPDEVDVQSWRTTWDDDIEPGDGHDAQELKDFQKYYLSRPDQKSQIERLIEQGKNSEVELLKSHIISDYIRNTHALRARGIIERDWLGKIKYRDLDLTVDFANLCFSHNEDVLSLFNLEINQLCGPDVYANMQLIAVVLRISDILDFDAKRTPEILFSHLFVRHPISLSEWKKHRSVEARSVSPELIQFHATIFSQVSTIIIVVKILTESIGFLTRLTVQKLKLKKIFITNLNIFIVRLNFH